MSASPTAGSLCLHCGYDLRGLTRNICPECGNSFDPADPYTYVHPACGRLTKRFRRALAPPPLFDCIFVAVAAALVLARSSSPGWPNVLVYSSKVEQLGSTFWLPFHYAAGLIALVGSWRHFAARRRIQRFNPTYRDSSKRWPIMLISSMIMISSLLYPWPFWIRFAVSWPALKRVAEQDEIRREPSWIGIFHVKKVCIYSGGLVFFVTDDVWPNQYGISYTPNYTTPPGNSFWRSRQLAHRWWLTVK